MNWFWSRQETSFFWFVTAFIPLLIRQEKSEWYIFVDAFRALLTFWTKCWLVARLGDYLPRMYILKRYWDESIFWINKQVCLRKGYMVTGYAPVFFFDYNFFFLYLIYLVYMIYFINVSYFFSLFSSVYMHFTIFFTKLSVSTNDCQTWRFLDVDVPIISSWPLFVFARIPHVTFAMKMNILFIGISC